MTRLNDSVAIQARAMSKPIRVHLLAMVLNSPAGEIDVQLLRTAHGDDVMADVGSMVQAGILDREGQLVRPTHDALVRFGALIATPEDERIVTPGEHGRSLDTISDELIDAYDGILAAETVREFVQDSYELLASRASVRRFLPQLTARFAEDRLSALASLANQDARRRADILFVCVRNAGRSQIAAALTRSIAGDQVRVRTAGSAPAAQLDPTVRVELAELGIDYLTEFPRPLTLEVVRASGVVVTMGCGDACPVVPGRRYVDWAVEDPVGRSRDEVRGIIEDIGGRVERLLDELGVTTVPPAG